MNYTMIDRVEALAPAPERTRRRVEGMEELVASLTPGQVARIQLGDDEKVRPVI